MARKCRSSVLKCGGFYAGWPVKIIERTADPDGDIAGISKNCKKEIYNISLLFIYLLLTQSCRG